MEAETLRTVVPSGTRAGTGCGSPEILQCRGQLGGSLLQLLRATLPRLCVTQENHCLAKERKVLRERTVEQGCTLA